MFASKDLFLTRPSGYQISRSVRLRSSASAYFNRTPASATNRKTWTWSGWFKRGALGAGYLFGATSDSWNVNWTLIYFNSSNSLFVQDYATSQRFNLNPTMVFRDPSAWYHLVVAMDTTQATASDRIKIYVNGTQVTAFSTASYPSQNIDTFVDNTVSHQISGTAGYFDGYMTEINFIDGQALTPSSFGSTNAVTGVWQPIKYTGTYGTNGFYLNFSDNSNNTATTIGKDYSGNGNNWTPNNISVTAGVTYDSMLDVPTLYADGGNGRGNYSVINPLSTIAFPVTNGNLSVGASTTSNRCSKSSIAVSSGKWYWEFKASAISASGQIAGVCSVDALFSGGVVSSGYEVGYYSVNGNKYVNGTASAYGASWTTTDTIGVALDVDGGTVTFYKNNVSQGSISITAGQTWVANWTGQNVSDAVDFTFGQRPFTYTPPTGYSALNTQNLPTPTISNGATVMAATTYTGNGTSQSISNAVNGVSFQPDFVWYKNRSVVASHNLFDSVRGVNQYLISDSTAAEGTASGVTAFNSNGFSVGSLSNGNGSGNAIVAWQWNAGGSTVTNTSGSISSQVRANATAGFSVVTYTGTAANATVGHGLGVAPSMIITKNRDSATAWWVYHTSLGNTQYLVLNTTAAAATSSSAWNNTSPTSTVFSLGAANPSNANQDVAYCFASVAGYSAFGSYTGNGSADGPFVYLGFRPRWVLLKRTDTSSINGWYLYDSARDTYNLVTISLFPNQSSADTTIDFCDFVSNGFKIRTTGSDRNASGGTYIYAAFAESPFKLALAR